MSKRLYALVNEPYAWRMAFLRHFPGHTALRTKCGKVNSSVCKDTTDDNIRSETRYFSRLTQLANWRSEYLFRTRLIRSLERGKPSNGSGNTGSTIKPSKKLSAVLTYNSKLPWLVSNIHAVFNTGKKPPRAIQGASELGTATISDPTSGKVEKWGTQDPIRFAQLDEVMPNLMPYGLGEGLAAGPNIMDVSQPHGILAGEGFPGGQAYFRSINEPLGCYLGAGTGVVDTYPEIPKIPEMSEAISSVWLAKSSAVPAATQSMVGMLTGSTLGVVTAYALRLDISGPRYSNGDMTARWVVSPGVPIISLKVDDTYNVKRKAMGRLFAVALNALGEIYYLTEIPTTTWDRANGDDAVKHAWLAGRSVYWHLLEETRRVAREDDLKKTALRGPHSPRSPSESMKLSKDQLVAEAREIEKYLLYKPSHFRKVCEGWDMQRRLEVDFANDDGKGAGEGIFVIDCGLAEDCPACIRRYTRTKGPGQIVATISTKAATPNPPSLFGTVASASAVNARPLESQSPNLPPPTLLSPERGSPLPQHYWTGQIFQLKGHSDAITTSALDCSSHSVIPLSEDPLHVAGEVVNTSSSLRAESGTREIPGRRARFFAVGTKTGAVIVWNARKHDKVSGPTPIRIIQTESPEISCLALTALYLVHGGNDGLVQAWDHMASTTDPIRTINARSTGRVPRHMVIMNPALANSNTYSAVGAIFLDPDPAILRGVVSFGVFMRYWSYSSTGHPTGRKRRHRPTDRLASKRQGGTSSREIAAEEAEHRREKEQRASEQARLRSRFGIGAFGDLTEEEALQYAQMMSEAAYQQEEQRRSSDSAVDFALDTASSFSETTAETVTPEPSLTGASSSINGGASINGVDNDEDDYEHQIQQAIRLSLMEGVNESGPSQHGNSSGEYGFSVNYKPKSPKKGKASESGHPSGSSQWPNQVLKTGSSQATSQDDEDLAIALSLSLQDHNHTASNDDIQYDDFPVLNYPGGLEKGKGVMRW